MSKRFTRRPRAIHITSRDSGTLEALYEARYLTGNLIQRLFYPPTSASWCRQRLRYLFDAGFIRKRRAYPNEPDVYYLGLHGRRHISYLHSLPREYVDKIAGVQGDVPAPMLMMNHELTLSHLYVNAVLECRLYGYRLRWENTRMLELKRLGVQPDACLRVQGIHRSEQAYVEYTGVMPTRMEMTGKLAGYRQLFEAAGPVIVLWLTNAPAKLAQLKAAILGHPYRDWFLVGLAQNAQQILTADIWWQAQSTRPVRFITPRTRVIYQARDRGYLPEGKGGGPMPNARTQTW